MSVPFRARNPVIIGAVSLAVIAVLILGAFRAQDLPLIGGGDTYYAAFSESGGLKANDEVRIAGVRVGKVEKRRARRRPREGHLPGRRPTRTSAPRPRPRSRSRRCSARCTSRCEPAGSGQLARRRGDPRRAHQLAVRRRGRVLRPRRDLRADRHRPARQVAHDAGRPDPEHPRGVPRRPRRRLAALRRTSRRATTRSTRCCKNLDRVSTRPRRPRPGHRRADEGLRRAVPGAGPAPRRRSTTCWSRPRPLSKELTAAGAAEPRRPQARPDPPRAASCRC